MNTQTLSDRRVEVRYLATGAVRCIPLTAFDPTIHVRVASCEENQASPTKPLPSQQEDA